jgi:hypothetical protein
MIACACTDVELWLSEVVPPLKPPVVPGPVAESPAPGGSSAFAGLGDLAELKNGEHVCPDRDHADKQAERRDGGGFLNNSADHDCPLA